MNPVNLEEPVPPSDEVYLGCTHRACWPNLEIAQEKKDSLGSPITAGIVKHSAGKNLPRTLSLGLHMWKDMQRNVWRDTANWQTRKSINKESPRFVWMISN